MTLSRVLIKLVTVLLVAGAMLSVDSFVAALEPADEHGSCPAWSYSGANGPEHWGDLCAEFAACKNGREQAPLNIVNPQVHSLPAIRFAYHAVALDLVNNGHSIEQNFAPGNGNTITVDGKKYEMAQFHFHHPSEEAIDGKRYDMVAHFVHAGTDGHFAVIGVLIKEGKANPLITTLWKNLPEEKGKANKSTAVEVNAIELIPATHNYYMYKGSLTTPPCTEGITFYILDTPMELSKEQIAKFAEYYPDNARPDQPLNGRTIEHSK
jgi:carbonic anhydrase